MEKIKTKKPFFGTIADMKYFLYVTGCDMNYSDAERIATVFNEYGFSIAGSEEEADIIVAVACSVREKAVHKIYGKVEKWKRAGTRNILVTGCVLPQDKKKFGGKVDLVFEIKEIDKLKKFLEKMSEIKNSEAENQEYLSIHPQYNSKYSANVPIMTGCDNFCSYCAVPYTRGREVSRSEDEILEEVKGLVENGYKEVTLLGQNVNSYKGKNGGFVELIKKIDEIDGDHWIRFYANHPKDMSDELIDFLANSKHFVHYIHLPLQSGDDEILKKMNRHYSAKQYLELVKKIREKIPDVVLTTDIIVGFPGESEKAFQNTVNVMKKSKFDMAFIAEYSRRSGTVASKLEDDVSHQEKDKRKRFLNDEVFARSILENNEKLVGTKVKTLVGKKDKKGFYIAKTSDLKDVKISGSTDLEIGSFVDVKITKAGSWGLEGEL